MLNLEVHIPNNLGEDIVHSYMKIYGKMFDGDQITVRGVFSIQANKSCQELMYKKQNFLDISGGLKRKTEKEAVQTLYQLTSDV